MTLSITSTVRLNNGVDMPLFGLGTWQSKDGDEAYQSVFDAIQLGYRHIDTAAIYGNEESVGRAVKDAGVPRDQLFITTKLWNGEMRTDNVAGAMDASLKRLGMDHVDLYLVHWPVKQKFVRSYLEMEKLLAQGKTRAIGVSNFLEHHLDDLAEQAKVMPAVNQVEWHPWQQSRSLVERCKSDGIAFEAWSPLMQGKVGDVAELVSIGEKHGKSPAQVAIRWGLQKGIIMIPKSVKRHRIEENANVFDFNLDAAEVKTIDGLDRDHRFGSHPDTFTF